MACSEKSSLWGYAAGELGADARARLEQHLAGCEPCRAELEAIEATREVLSFAAPVEPAVDWRRADGQVHEAIEKRMLRAEHGWSWLIAGLAGAGALAMVLAVQAINRRPQPVDPHALALIAPVAVPSALEAAEGAMVSLGADEHQARPGEDLKAGAAVRTTPAGKALLKLPEGSRVRVAAASDLLLQRAARDEVGLVLRGGRVAVKATHAARKEFVVEAGEAAVRVVGTAFSVGLDDKLVDVAVAEGRVLVELSDGRAQLVRAGERLTFDRARSELRTAGLIAADKSEMDELGVPVALAEAPRPRPAAPKPAVPAVAPVPAPQSAPPPAVAAPVAAAPEAPPPPEPRPEPEPLRGFTVEQQKIHEAEEADKRGQCARYLEPLREILEDSEDLNAQEKARILRARCLRALDREVEANAEYRRYLEEFPRGPGAREAHQFLGY